MAYDPAAQAVKAAQAHKAARDATHELAHTLAAQADEAAKQREAVDRLKTGGQ